MEENEIDTVRVQRRSYYLLRDIRKGERIEEKDIFPLRPVQKGGYFHMKIRNNRKKLIRDKKKEEGLLWE